MKKNLLRSTFALTLAGVLTTVPLVADPPDPKPVGENQPFKSMTLDNGLEVIVIEDYTVPLVTIDIAVRNGAFTEPDEFAGLSHLYEHMFFKANAVYPSQEAFMNRVKELGVSYNGYTSDELVNYFFTLPSGNLKEGMEFMAAAIMTPKFDPDELVKERQVVLGEFDRNEAQPQFVLRYALDSAVWMPYVSRKQPLGQRHVINTATVEKMAMIQKRFYVPNNSALIVSGAVNADEVFQYAMKYLSGWERGADPFPTYDPPKFPSLESKLVIREAAVPNALVRMFWHGPSVLKDEPNPYIADILFTMVNQPTSRFYRELVDSGLVTNVYLGYQSARNTGEIALYATAIPEKAEKALEVIKRELQAMTKPGYFTDEDLEIAKQILADNRVFERENIYNFTIRTVAFWWSVAGGLDYYEGLNEHYTKVSQKQTQEFVRNFIVGKPFVLGVGAKGEVLDKLNITSEDLKW
ncbi:MAG: insulinase family protein [Ignavibacteriae bacterium]|nr:insulinase family protein [Ignavibacteriota bacterium]MCB9215580.1 insulinase family protein [Ignavibacteria bacterium]